MKWRVKEETSTGKIKKKSLVFLNVPVLVLYRYVKPPGADLQFNGACKKTVMPFTEFHACCTYCR